ncbi:MAG TPA: aldehyde dehydrogenase EutE [Myxococcota bacterium]|nr:aldehyde dehydrogenase EutE [Myxococcota bacterium]HRY93415.1 aldehyde dehydrogenase EutE [Myxococcota bacterium]HSA21324.1 aldehyde dehydrogenase EutE [Myxococcota bacterium]
MSIGVNPEQLERLVAEVVRRVQAGEHPAAPAASAPPPAPAAAEPAEGVFATVDEAFAAAERSYREYTAVSLHRRRGLIEAMRKVATAEAEALARMAVEETGLGRVEDKIQKNLLAARKTPGVEDLTPLVFTGDDGLTLVEPGPFGVVGAITPTTNPAATIINNSISIVAAGNAVVFNPHPSARRTSNRAVALLNRAIREAGGPARLLTSLAAPSLESSEALMKHPGIRLLLVTGGGVVVQLAMRSGKRCIAAGPGNPPVIVDDTAVLAKAARCIHDGASFDNNVLCTAEKEVFVFENVADELLHELVGCGAYLARGAEIDALAKVLVDPPEKPGGLPHPQKKFVGKDAAVLLQAAGIRPGREVRLVVCETVFEHPFVQAEMLMPILPVVRVRDLEEALARAKAAEHGYRHSAYMHSESVSNMSRVARDIETTIFVKNAPSYAGLGFGGEGHCTLSIAGPTGEGLTSARSFTRQRRCVLAGAFRIV